MRLFAYLLCSVATSKPLYAGQGHLGRVKCYSKPSIQKRFGEPAKIGFIIICNSRQEALLHEKELIAKYDPPFNIARWDRSGGIKRSAETRKKLSISHRNSKRCADQLKRLHKQLIGHTVSKETRIKMSISAMGRPGPMLGKKFELNHRLKIAAAVKKSWEKRRVSP